MKLPTIKSITALVKAVKLDIADDYRAFEEDDLPGIQLTIGVDVDTGDWSFQTGDNSYSGGAYGYAYWGVTGVYRCSNSRDVAKDLLNQIADQASN